MRGIYVFRHANANVRCVAVSPTLFAAAAFNGGVVFAIWRREYYEPLPFSDFTNVITPSAASTSIWGSTGIR